MKEKAYVSIPVWMATTVLAASIAFPVWIVKSISDLQANVAGLSVKVEFLVSSPNTQHIAKQ